MPRARDAFGVYLLTALGVTWPLARGIGRDVAWDLGDPVLVMWALAWDSERILRILGGDIAATASFFQANIFHPAPYTLAYSDHFIVQALQSLPVYLFSDNIILCYNLLFLSTFVLSALGMFLLVRELTGSGWAALLAGLVFGFAPYRFSQASHLQVLSSQWMPFVLLNLTRYAADRRRSSLAWATGALVAQSLSSGYYLLYFTPFAAAYGLWELGRRGALRSSRVWVELTVASGAAIMAMTPFLLPYAAIRDDLPARPLLEVTRFSADVYAYATAFGGQPFWAPRLRVFPQPEGDLFPGAVPLLLAAIGVAGAFRAAAREHVVAEPAVTVPAWRRWGPPLLTAVAGVHAVAAALTLAWRRVIVDLGLVELRMTNVNQLLLRASIAAGLLLAISPTARARARAFVTGRGAFLLALLAALWLSLGPAPHAGGRPLNLAGVYGLLYDFVPGFNGVRVPARFSMVALLMLAVLAGYGAATLARRAAGRAALAVLAILFVAEARPAPFVVNGASPVRGYTTPPARLVPVDDAPEIYNEVARQPEGLVLLELPLGQPDYDLRAMYYSAVHWRPLVNGYSGFFPPPYARLALALSDVVHQPDIAWAALTASGATHVLVHEAAYPGRDGSAVSAALRARGAREIFASDRDLLFALAP